MSSESTTSPKSTVAESDISPSDAASTSAEIAKSEDSAPAQAAAPASSVTNPPATPATEKPVPEPAPKPTPPTTAAKLNAYRQLYDLMAGWRPRYLAAIVVMALAIGLDYLIPVTLAAAVDLVLGASSGEANQRAVEALRYLGVRPNEPRTLLIPAAIVLIIATLSGLFMFLKGRWVATACEGVIQSLRNRLYDHLQRAPLTFHDKLQTGDVVQRCTSDVETLKNFYTNQIIEISRAALLLIIGVPMLLILDWRMGLVAIAMIPPIIAFSFIFFTKVKHRFKASDDAEGLMSAVLQENLTGIRVVRAFNRQDFEITRFDEKNNTHRSLDWKLYKLMSIFWSSSDAMCFTQILLVLGYGCYSVSNGRISVGELLFFITSVWRFLWPVREMGRTLTETGKAVVSVGRVHEVASHPAEYHDSPANSQPLPPHSTGILPVNNSPAPKEVSPSSPLTASLPNCLTASPLPPSPPALEIRNLSFSHNDKKILSNISLTIPPGQTLALLGPSGAGKTTLIAILLRFYDYTEGSITLGGVELRDLPLAAVRAHFATVLQEPFLFSKSIRDNIRLGRADFEPGGAAIPDSDIIAAAQSSAVHESIEGFDKKYDTLLGERGVTLSGGQRQRVAIARALLRSSPILILDDALSAVDTHTESQILEALKSRHKSHPQTTILIAHRLSTLMHADQIAVLEQGHLTQLGTHQDLVSQEGLYQRLWQIQTALEEDLRTELEEPPLSSPSLLTTSN